MDLIFTIFVAVLILSFLVLIHELGHFYMAKRAGIKVEEFGMGLPPRLWGKKKGETVYSINWIPFGGFVRMFGEDFSDSKSAKSKRSFAGQSIRARILVVIAGVVMNFLLAVLLLAIGFTIGMRPLLGPADVLPAVSDGGIVIESGLRILEVESGGLGESLGFVSGDRIVEMNGALLDSFSFNDFMSGLSGEVLVVNDSGVKRSVELSGEELGLSFSEATSFPRLKVLDLPKFDPAYVAGLRPSDVILRVNDKEIFDFEVLRDLLKESEQVSYTVWRDGEELVIKFVNELSRGVYINDVIVDSPAEAAGLKFDDLVVEVDGEKVFGLGSLLEQISSATDEVALTVLRDEGLMMLMVTPDEQGKIGAYLSEVSSLNLGHDLEVVNADLIATLVEIKEVKAPFYLAPFVAFKEAYRLSVLTLDMVLGVFAQIFSGNGVPDGVAGPVGIVQMAGVVASEGGIPLLQFIAILSLSLAVMNILPIPALDGGRLLFLLVEAVIGRKINQKLEAYIHAFGYLLLIALIILVTYNDIFRIFTE